MGPGGTCTDPGDTFAVRAVTLPAGGITSSMGLEPFLTHERARRGHRGARAALGLWGLGILLGCGEPGKQAEPSASELTAPAAEAADWTGAELALLESLSLSSLSPPPPSPSNRVADDPVAAELGHHLFFDRGLSSDGSVSCASCHIPDLYFTDGLATAQGLGSTTRNSPTIVASAHSPWQFWDGRRDSLWAQALAPIESSVEMGATRTAVVRHVAGDPLLADLYQRAFGASAVRGDPAALPASAGPFGSPEEQEAWYRMSDADRQRIDTAFANIGKAIAAYERLVAPGPSRFDRWVEELRTGRAVGTAAQLDEQEIEGLRLFIDPGRTLCLRCHNGPLLTNHAFHDIGTAHGDGRLPDLGRYLGLQAVLIDPFNCLGRFSDAAPEDCRELRFLDKRHTEAQAGKFKTPTLRGVPRTAPYMHDGRFATLREVVDHYRSPPVDRQPLEITPLELDDAEAEALVAFLGSLDSEVDANAAWLRPPPAEPPPGSPASQEAQDF